MIQACALNGKPGYQSGDDGQCFTYEDGNEVARQAARAKATNDGTRRAERTGDLQRAKMRKESSQDEEQSVRVRTEAQIRAQKAKPKPVVRPMGQASQVGVHGVHSSQPLKRSDDQESPVKPLYQKTEVSYGPGRAEQECGNCRFFYANDGGTGSCRLVKGAIDEEAWCQLFSAVDAKDLEKDDEDDDSAQGEKSLTENQLTKFYELKDVKLDDVQGTRRSWVPVFPEGTFKHPEYGDLDFSDAELRKYLLNFRQKVRKIEIAVDIDHKNEDAVGWLKDLEIRRGVGLFGLVEWNQHGAGLIADKRYRYISPQFGEYLDEASGTTYDPVLVALTITNFPFLKSMAALQLRKKEGKGPTVTGRERMTSSTRLKRAKQADEASDLDEADEKASWPNGDEEDKPARPANAQKPAVAKKSKRAGELDDEAAELDDDASEASELDEASDLAEADDSQDDDSNAKKASIRAGVVLSGNARIRQLQEENARKDRRLRLLEAEMRETQQTLRMTAVRDQVRSLADQSKTAAFTKPVIDAFKELALSDKKAGNALFKVLSLIQRDGLVSLSTKGRADDPDDERNDPTGHGTKVLREPKTGKPLVGTSDQKRAQMYAKEHKLDWSDLEDRTKAYIATIDGDDKELDESESGYTREV